MTTTVRLYLDDCSECQRARRYLEEHDIAVDERQVVADALTERDLDQLAQHAGDVTRLVRPELKDEVTDLEREEILGYLATDPYRVAHPIVHHESTVHVGFDERLRAAFSSP